MEEKIFQKIIQKKEFSEIPREDIERAFSLFEKREVSEEEKIRLTRDLLRKVFSGFAGKKMLGWKDKPAEVVLKKHLSTRERFDFYTDVYSRVLKGLPKELTIIDLGCGANGFSYDFFSKTGKKAKYIGIEAVGQLVGLTNEYFKKNKFDAVCYHLSIFEIEKIVKIVKKSSSPRVLFLLKVVDALETLERNYTKTLLKKLVPLFERVAISFPVESWVRRKKFFVRRTWLIDFIKERWQFIDDFIIGGERYLLLKK